MALGAIPMFTAGNVAIVELNKRTAADNEDGTFCNQDKELDTHSAHQVKVQVM